ncbi:hypothetical protein [Bartonella tamiae]|uniref:Uncharacterized protein n=1 Tax=Bartonella tamiae Th239 TaxID=1094558 RepID=J1JXG9_9HYPH|nr:hypothetical protein [Bartonella tamiae]EJF89315.1 hypothetical protein ME5_01866 [Bartonella tamiae Th239]EJF95523.1 hypothetical protein MEG_00013 [Bartonella tamiae Th307]
MTVFSNETILLSIVCLFLLMTVMRVLIMRSMRQTSEGENNKPSYDNPKIKTEHKNA